MSNSREKIFLDSLPLEWKRTALLQIWVAGALVVWEMSTMAMQLVQRGQVAMRTAATL
jgi:hypothetical protein